MIPQKKPSVLYVLLVFSMALAVLWACSASPTETPVPATPTKFTVPTPMLPPPTEPPPPEPTATDVPPTPTEEVAEEPTEVPVAEEAATEEPAATEEAPVVTAGGSDTCIACHTSQETLEALAEVTEVKSEETSGEG